MPTVVKGSCRCEIRRDAVELARGSHHAGADWLFKRIIVCSRESLAPSCCSECRPATDME